VPIRADIAGHPLLSCRISGEGRKDRGAIRVGNPRGARMAGPQGFHRSERSSFRERWLSWFVAISEGVRRELKQFYPGSHAPSPRTVWTISVSNLTRNRAHKLRQELGAGQDHFVAVSVGTVGRARVDPAIGTVAIARSHCERVSLWVVGPGDPSP
jgi:hypothetical protein